MLIYRQIYTDIVFVLCYHVFCNSRSRVRLTNPNINDLNKCIFSICSGDPLGSCRNIRMGGTQIEEFKWL